MGLNKKPLILLAILAGMLVPSVACADDDHRVLMIIRKNDGTNGHDYFVPHLVSVTTNKVEDIAALQGNPLFGLDDQTVACKAGKRLLVLDRHKLTVSADLVLTNYQNVILKSAPDENLAVDSARGKVYLPVYLHNPYTGEFARFATNYETSIHAIAALEVDWKTGQQVLFATPGNYSRVISLPNAVGVEDGHNISLYNKSDHESLMSFTETTPSQFFHNQATPGDFYHVPGLGLFESRSIFDDHGQAAALQFQVCDLNFATNHVSPLQVVITNSPSFTAFDSDGEFFIRNIDRKPHWIWIEERAGTNTWTIARIIMASVESGKETVREPLNIQASNPRFMPNDDASKVYFFDAKLGQIYSFDRNSKTTTAFFNLRGYTPPWAFVGAD